MEHSLYTFKMHGTELVKTLSSAGCSGGAGRSQREAVLTDLEEFVRAVWKQGSSVLAPQVNTSLVLERKKKERKIMVSLKQ